MTTEATETLLRESLQAHVDDVGTITADPWLRVSRAHRRSRFRRRTAAVGALVAAAAVTGSLAGTQPWADQLRTTQPANPTQPADPTPGGKRDLGWLQLDDGTPRGALGNDPALRQAVVKALLKAGLHSPNAPQLTQDTVHLLWGGELEGKRVALVRALHIFDPKNHPQRTEVLLWLTGPTGGGAMKPLSINDEGPAIKALPYLDAQGGRRLLAVVGRDAQVAATRTTISAAEGELERAWSPVPVHDGVVDVPVPDPFGRGPLLLQAWPRSGSPGGGFASSATLSPSTGSDPVSGLTPAQLDTLVKQGRGPGLKRGRPHLASSAVESAVTQLWSDAAHTSPRVEWSGTVPAARGGGSLVVASAGFPGQGRVLSIRRFSADQGDPWRYVGAVPADAPFGADSAYAWRLSPYVASDEDRLTRNQHVIVWMFGPDTTSVTVDVNGKTRKSTTQDGLGWMLVDKGDQVAVTGRTTDTDATRLTAIELRPKDVEPVGSDLPLLGRQ